MSIISSTTHNPKIDIAEVQGDLTGTASIDLQKYLYTCLDYDRRYQIINLKQTKKIDNLAINILEDFGFQGIWIGLINACPEIIRMLKVTGRKDIVKKIYDVTDNDKAVSLFEKEILTNDLDVDKRSCTRISTNFPCTFSIIYYSKHYMINENRYGGQPCQNETIVVTANIHNLSEGGIFADNIIAFNTETEKEIVRPETIGKKLDNLKFRLNGSSKIIETRGEYVRQFRNREKLSAAIQFKDISNDSKEMIREYIQKEGEMISTMVVGDEKDIHESIKITLEQNSGIDTTCNCSDVGTIGLIENSEKSVLLDGKTETAKDLLAATIHYNSLRRDKMFIAQTCSGFTKTILSSELFGHKKGAFAGAVSDKTGLLEIANEGTLFLDEIADMDMDAQTKLLRVLETGTFYSTGSAELKKVNVRILAASNNDLQKQVEKGLFREDLLSRINTLHITNWK